MIFQKEKLLSICQNYLKPLWLSAPESFPAALTELVPEEEKKKNEDLIERYSAEIRQHMNKLNSKNLKMYPLYRKKWAKKAEGIWRQLFFKESILSIHSYLAEEQLANVIRELKKFLKTARGFDPTMPFADLGQAIRNYLVYAMFLELLGKEQQNNPAIFGYSMLYPVTDNYIDGDRSTDEKDSYHQLIQNKIKNQSYQEASEHGQKTIELLLQIERVYPRDKGSEIYDALLLMLDAQQESLQQRTKKAMSLDQILAISLYKGGVSVLIDRYLAEARMTEEELRFFLGFGFVLQLADDLQDISTDLEQGNQTIFTLEPTPNQIEGRVNQLFQFTNEIFTRYQAKNTHFQQFLYQSSLLLILISVEMSSEHFNQEYLNKLEAYCPVHYDFLKKYSKDSALYSGGLKEEELMLAIDTYLDTE